MGQAARRSHGEAQGAILAERTARAADNEFVRGKADPIVNLSNQLTARAIAEASGDDEDTPHGIHTKPDRTDSVANARRLPGVSSEQRLAQPGSLPGSVAHDFHEPLPLQHVGPVKGATFGQPRPQSRSARK